MLHLGAILLILDPFWDDVGSILESFLTFSKSYLKVRVLRFPGLEMLLPLEAYLAARGVH